MAFQIKSKESILNVFQSLRTVTYCIYNLKVDTCISCEFRSQVEKATKWVTTSIIDNLTEQRRASKREPRLGSTCASDEDLVWGGAYMFPNVWRKLYSSLVCSDSLTRRREDEYDKEGKHCAHFTHWSALILSLLKVLLIWLSQTPNTDCAEAVSGCNIWVGMQFNQCIFTLSLITLQND